MTLSHKATMLLSQATERYVSEVQTPKGEHRSRMLYGLPQGEREAVRRSGDAVQYGTGIYSYAMMKVEEQYQSLVVEYLDGLCVLDESIRFTAIEPSLYLHSGRQKKRKSILGVRPGFPDLLIAFPPQMFFLEMKKEDTTLTADQPVVFEILSKCNIPIFTAHDPIEAIEIINDMLKKTGRNDFV